MGHCTRFSYFFGYFIYSPKTILLQRPHLAGSHTRISESFTRYYPGVGAQEELSRTFPSRSMLFIVKAAEVSADSHHPRMRCRLGVGGTYASTASMKVVVKTATTRPAIVWLERLVDSGNDPSKLLAHDTFCRAPAGEMVSLPTSPTLAFIFFFFAPIYDLRPNIISPSLVIRTTVDIDTTYMNNGSVKKPKG